MAAGVIYILVTPTDRNLLKIGKTTRSAEERVAEISNGSGVPAPYWVVYDDWVQDCHKAERLIHSRLSSYRFRGNREFFNLPLKKAIPVVIKAIEQVNAEFKEATKEVHNRQPVIGRAANMTQILGPNRVSITLKDGPMRKVYFQKGNFLVTDGYLEWKAVVFSYRWITSVQIWEGKPEGFLTYALLINTLQGDVAKSNCIYEHDRGTIMEVFRLLTTAK